MDHYANTNQPDDKTKDQKPLEPVSEAHDHSGHDGEYGESDGLSVCEVRELANGPLGENVEELVSIITRGKKLSSGTDAPGWLGDVDEGVQVSVGEVERDLWDDAATIPSRSAT